MKLYNSIIGLITILFLIGCAKDGLWNQDTEVQRGRVVGTLTSTEDGSPLSGVKILFERQTKASGANSFVDTVGTNAEGKFSYEIPFPNKVRVVLRDTGRYVADTAFVDVAEGTEYTIALQTAPRFGVAKVISTVVDQNGKPLPEIKVGLFLRESNNESYVAADTIMTNAQGQATFENIAFPVNYMVKIVENPKAYEIDSVQNKLTSKQDVQVELKTRTKYGKGTIDLIAKNYHSLKALKGETVNIQVKSVFDEDFSAIKQYQLDANGKVSIPNFIYPAEIKITPTSTGHPFAPATFSLEESNIVNGFTFELRDLKPRYEKPVYTNLKVSTLDVGMTLANPTGIANDSKGNIYFSDGSGHKIIRVDRKGEAEVLISGSAGTVDGPLETATVNQVWGLIVDGDDNIYFVDNGASGSSHKVRKITFDAEGGGVVSTIAGSGASGGTNGVGTAATFNRPAGLAIDNDAQILYVGEWGGHRVRKIDLATKTVTTLMGTGAAANTEGFGVNAAINQPAIGLALSPDNKKLYVGGNASNSDPNSRIGVIDVSTGAFKFFVGNNGDYRAGAPRGMYITSSGDMIYSANAAALREIRIVNLNQTVGDARYTKLAGSGAGYTDGNALTAKFAGPLGITYNPWTGNWYIADGDGSTKNIRIMRSADID